MSDAYPLKFARRFSVSALFEVGKVVRLSVLINTSKCGVSVLKKRLRKPKPLLRSEFLHWIESHFKFPGR